VKAPYLGPVAATWNGLYFGGNVGYGVGRYKLNDNLTIPSTGVATQVTFGDTSAGGVLGGGQIGYNWQLLPRWVLGVEADFQAANIAQTYCGAVCNLVAISAGNKLEWFGTIRPRFGYAQDGWLAYVTGGYAFARMQSDYSISSAASGISLTTLTVNHDLSGWTLGGGVETRLWGAWSAKVEYLYLNLTPTQDTLNFNLGGPASVTYKTTYQDHIARIGLNYRFGGLYGY
jgi:outer membrane immunogenic protein